MDADLARLVRLGTITPELAQQRASVPEELMRLLAGGGIDAAQISPQPVAGMVG